MSTGAECNFIEREPDKWFYELQDYPYGYTEDYTEYGPFDTFEKADDHLRYTHANPGGYSTQRHPDHVHRYQRVQPSQWDRHDKPYNRCIKCSQDEPVNLDCGECLDYHRPPCGEYVMTANFKITMKRARDLLDGESTIEASVLEVARSQVEGLLSRFENA